MSLFSPDEVLRNATLPDLGASPLQASDAGDSAPLSDNDVQRVQQLMEECMRAYLSLDEMVRVLAHKHSVDEQLTRAVYAAMKAKHAAWLESYEARLRCLRQITAFNFIASKQLQALQNERGALPVAKVTFEAADDAAGGGDGGAARDTSERSRALYDSQLLKDSTEALTAPLDQ